MHRQNTTGNDYREPRHNYRENSRRADVPQSSQNSRGAAILVFRLRRATESPIQRAARISAAQRKGRRTNSTQPRKRLESPCTQHHTPRTQASRRLNDTSVRTLTTREGRSHDVSTAAASRSRQERGRGRLVYQTGRWGWGWGEGNRRACAMRGRRSWPACSLSSGEAAGCRGNEERFREGAAERGKTGRSLSGSAV